MGEPPQIRRALVSAYDKQQVVPLVRALHEEFGVQIVASGGTARVLREVGVAVTDVASVVGSGELLGGRVKTLHPALHAAILADRGNEEHMRDLRARGIEPIDLVVVTLYPFGKTISRPEHRLEDALEMIDIGGPALVRAAAKNWQWTTVVVEPGDFERVLVVMREAGRAAVPADLRRALAARAFQTTARYDRLIWWYLAAGPGGSEPAEGAGVSDEQVLLDVPPTGEPVGLRYGENPHQPAVWLPVFSTGRVRSPGWEVVDGSVGDLSYTNWLDADVAFRVCADVVAQIAGSACACAVIKHATPCGAAVVTGDDAEKRLEAWRRAYLGDAQAAMGGVAGMTFAVDETVAQAVMGSLDRWGRSVGAGAFFLDVWVAPGFEPGAVRLIRSAKPWGRRVRLVSTAALGVLGEWPVEVRSVAGALLVQRADVGPLGEEAWRVVSRREPGAREWSDLRVAWAVSRHARSNAVVIVADGAVVGVGAGQVSRVDSARVAAARMSAHYAARRQAPPREGLVAASDGFFPFRDGVDVLADAGVRAIIQPGGSRRDDEVIMACNERNIALVHTGVRHFRH